PLFDELLDQLGRVLQIGDDADDRVAARVDHRVVRRTDVAEVARVDDDLDVFVLRGDLPQDGHGAVPGGVVDEDVFVAVAADFLENLFDLLVTFPDVFLLVEAAADDADELFPRRLGMRRGGSDAGGGTF